MNKLFFFIFLITFHVSFAQTANKPNIIWFVGDDQTWSDHRTYGNSNIPTPVTDLLGKESLVFNRAYTGQSLCAPSRAIMLTGRSTLRNGVFLNHFPIKNNLNTLPVQLKGLGYKTAIVGKVYHVMPKTEYKWDRVLPVHKVKDTGEKRDLVDMGALDSYFSNSKDTPFFLVINSHFPHGPFVKDAAFSAEDGVSASDVGKSHRSYRGSIVRKEQELKKVLDLMDKHNLKNNTMFLYTDDHGMKGKGTCDESGLRVAFMVRWPGVVQPGVTNAIVSYEDLLPTSLEIAGGANQDPSLDAFSFLPVLKGEGSSKRKYAYGVAMYQGRIKRWIFPQRTITDGNYRYIHSFNTKEGEHIQNTSDSNLKAFYELGYKKFSSTPQEQLYNISKDPQQKNNLANSPENAEKLKTLKERLGEWMIGEGDFLKYGGQIPIFAVKQKYKLDVKNKDNPIGDNLVGSLSNIEVHPHKVEALR